MFLAIVAFLVQSSMAPQIAFSAEKLKVEPSEVAALVPAPDAPDSLVVAPKSTLAPAPQPADPEPFIVSQAAKKDTVSVEELRAETKPKQRLWLELSLVEHSSASFDAATTRYAIADQGGHELNPLLKPFAGNASIFVAIQVGPTVMDYVARKMMYSRHSWVRRMWWVPQGASTFSSLFCGAHNLGVHSPGN